MNDKKYLLGNKEMCRFDNWIILLINTLFTYNYKYDMLYDN